MRRTLQIGVTALVFLVAACTPGTQQTASPTSVGADSIVGTWNCEPEVLEIQADGTATFTEPNGTVHPGHTWSVEGNLVTFTDLEGQEHPGTIEADRLVFDDGLVCTRAT
jgi:hypothetical protein